MTNELEKEWDTSNKETDIEVDEATNSALVVIVLTCALIVTLTGLFLVAGHV